MDLLLKGGDDLVTVNSDKVKAMCTLLQFAPASSLTFLYLEMAQG